jgi:hypothetical protein
MTIRHDRMTDDELLATAAQKECLSLELMAQAEACLAEIRRRRNDEKIPLSVTAPLLEACAVISAMGITDKTAIRFILTEALRDPAADAVVEVTDV